MNEREKELFISMAECLDDLPEGKKGEFIGYAKCMADMKKKKEASVKRCDLDKYGGMKTAG